MRRATRKREAERSRPRRRLGEAIGALSEGASEIKLEECLCVKRAPTKTNHLSSALLRGREFITFRVVFVRVCVCGLLVCPDVARVFQWCACCRSHIRVVVESCGLAHFERDNDTVFEIDLAPSEFVDCAKWQRSRMRAGVRHLVKIEIPTRDLIPDRELCD